MTVRQRDDGTGESTSVWPFGSSAAANATLRLKTHDDIDAGRHDVLIVGVNEKFTFPARLLVQSSSVSEFSETFQTPLN